VANTLQLKCIFNLRGWLLPRARKLVVGAIAPIEFEEPIALPDGRELITLHDAPRSSPSCRSASTTRRNGSGHRGAHAGGQHGGPAMRAQIGMMRALFRDEKPVPTRREKPAKKYRIV
jgi:hypothetical protein